MPTYQTYKLGEICELLNGYAFKSSNYVPNGLRVIRITNVKKGYVIDEEPQFYPIETQEELKKYILKKDDLLISLTGNVGRVGILGEALLPAALNQRVGCLRIKDKSVVFLQYLYHLLNTNSFEKDCINSSRGIAQKNMSTEWLKDYEVSLPPLPTQHQIVSRIESLFAELDKAEEHLRTAQQQLKTYRQAVLNHWLTKGSEKWEKVTIGDIVEKVEYGSSAKSQKTGRVPVLRMGNIQNGRFDWSDLVYSDDDEEIKKYLLHKDDVLFNRTNSPELVGKTAIYKGERPAIFAGYLIRLHRKEDLINADFLNYYLNSDIAKNYGNTVKSDGVNQSNINGQKLKTYPLFLPPLPDQQRIVDEIETRLSQAEAAEARIAESLQKTETLRQSILKKAFSGELVSTLQ